MKIQELDFITFSFITAKIQSLDLWESSSLSREKSEEDFLQNNLPFSFLSMLETTCSSSGSSADASHL